MGLFLKNNPEANQTVQQEEQYPEEWNPVNFGACKGETFDRVLIYPNGPLTDFIMKNKTLKAPEKYYVGVTRPRYSIAIVLKTIPKALNGYEEVTITCENTQIRCNKPTPYHSNTPITRRRYYVEGSGQLCPLQFPM